MPRRGGPSTLTGVDYQVIYTATRFAEAITNDSILSLRPEAHVTDSQLTPNSQSDSLTIAPPAVDDLTITHREGPSEFISLKHQAGQASWNTSQFIERGILTAFLQQHRSDALARLLLVTQSPIEAPLRDCIERAKHATAESLSTLGREPEQTFKKITAHIQQEQPDVQITPAEVLIFLGKIEFHILPQESLEKEMLLVLQPHVQDADAAKNVLYQYAMLAGKQQRRVTPESIREELLQRGQPLIVPPTVEVIIAQFDEVSRTLNDVPANIGQLPGYHIDRAEVAEIVSWVLEPLPFPKPGESLPARISRIVIGGAGVGKTVVLRDIYRALRECHLPVIALKADRTNGTTKGGLLTDIRENGLSYSLQQALAAVASPERPAVVIIDQLDALSMCLSAERGLLNSYTELLNDLHRLANVRFILSCRTFDLKHDPELAPFQAAKTVELSVLSIEQVDKVLAAAGLISTNELSAELVDLLQTPLHLSLYCALDDDARSGAPITSIQGLYDKLLLQFLIHPKRLPSNVSPNQVKDFLYAMAIAMHQNQQLMLPHLSWYDQDTNVFNYLSSQAVVITAGPHGQQVSFFHQTFYEYLFARQFVAKRQSLTDFVLSSGQGLFLRSMIQQVLAFLRGSDFEAYSLALRQLLSSEACRFHLRILIAQFLASQLKPESDEITIARELVLPNSNMLPAFIEVASARPWMELLAEPTVFLQLVPALEHSPMISDTTLASPLLWSFAKNAPDLILLKLQALPEGPHRKDWIIKSLDDMGACADANVPVLFEQAFDGELTSWQQLMRWHILNQQARVRPEWVASKAFEQLANAPFSDDDEHTRREDYQEAETINSLWVASAPLCFDLCSRLLRTWIRRANNYRDPQLYSFVWRNDRYGLYPAPYFLDQKDVAARSETPHNAAEAVLHYTWKYLEDNGNLHQPHYRLTVSKWLHSRTTLLVQMALAAINASPEFFADSTLRLFAKKGWLSEAVHRSHIGYFTLRIFPHAWDAASIEQKHQLSSKLISPSFMHDVDIRTDQKGKRIYYSRHGLDTLKYLQSLGTERLLEFPALKRKAEEFTRLWKRLPDEQPERRSKLTHGFPSPAAKWNVKKLTPEDWLRALRKYRNKERTIFSDEGTYTGLCHHLNRLIKESPSSWVSMLDYLIENEDESVTMLLPTLNEVDSDATVPLLERAYHKNLLNEEAYRHLQRSARKKSSDPEEEIKPEYVKHDLAKVMANLQAQSTIQFEDKNPKRDLLTAAINTPGAIQLYELLREKLPEALVPEVVAVLKEVATKGSIPVRTAAVEPLAMLTRTALPVQVTIDLFTDLIGTDFMLLSAGQWSLNHLTWRDPNSMLALMERAITEPAAHESITRVLTVQWGHDTPGAHNLLIKIWELNPAMKAIALDQLTIGYAVWKNRDVFFQAFRYFLSCAPDKELILELDEAFRDFPPEDFLLIQPLLPHYICTCVPRTEYNHFFLDYLAKCVKQFPAECIHLLGLFFHELNKSQPRYPYSRNALKILIEAYTRLPHQNAQDANVQAALDLFDLLLSRSDVRNELSKVMQEVSAY